MKTGSKIDRKLQRKKLGEEELREINAGIDYSHDSASDFAFGALSGRDDDIAAD